MVRLLADIIISNTAAKFQNLYCYTAIVSVMMPVLKVVWLNKINDLVVVQSSSILVVVNFILFASATSLSYSQSEMIMSLH